MGLNVTRQKWKLVLYWLATLPIAGLFAVPGTALLLRLVHFQAEMVRLGYPAYFLAPFGALKILGAAVILSPGLPRAKEWAYAGMIFDAGFAAYSRAAIGDPLPQILLPLAIASLALASWALRPDSRKL